MGNITIGSTVIEYTVRVSSRAKKISINVTPHDVEVVTPLNCDSSQVETFIEKQNKWIYTKREELLEAQKKIINEQVHKYRSGAKILYRGRRMSLRVTSDGLYNVKVKYARGFHISVPPSVIGEERDHLIKKALEKWLKAKALEDCQLLTDKYSKITGLKAEGVRIKEQKHLWGSCGHDKILNFNWKLIYAPKKVLEYVVAHEVTHLKYRNHDSEFWNLLRSVFNEVDECKVWLEKEGVSI